jgi:hypothetical protein
MSFADAYGIADDLDLPDGAAFALASELSGRDFYDDDDEAVYCPDCGRGFAREAHMRQHRRDKHRE